MHDLMQKLLSNSAAKNEEFMGEILLEKSRD
jgi:hypothetical protein